jgi:hypothetical protein
VRFEVALSGGGRVTLAAYGMADAEHRVEKEIRALCPGARIDVLGVERVDPERRIVEEFAVRYRLRTTLATDAETQDEARPPRRLGRSAGSRGPDRGTSTRIRKNDGFLAEARRSAEDAENVSAEVPRRVPP